MTTLTTGLVAATLEKLHRDADASDSELMTEMLAVMNSPDTSVEQAIGGMLAEERADYRSVYNGYADNFLAVSPGYGRFLYMMARACKARRIVEFGTSMGISTIYLTAALRDNGGGQLIGSELEASKVARARANLDAAGLADLADIREGDALETLCDLGGTVDLLLLDGAFSLYLPVLKLVEPQFTPGAIILGENAFDPDYLEYIGDLGNGYLARSLPLDEGRGNALAVRIA